MTFHWHCLLLLFGSPWGTLSAPWTTELKSILFQSGNSKIYTAPQRNESHATHCHTVQYTTHQMNNIEMSCVAEVAQLAALSTRKKNVPLIVRASDRLAHWIQWPPMYSEWLGHFRLDEAQYDHLSNVCVNWENAEFKIWLSDTFFSS